MFLNPAFSFAECLYIDRRSPRERERDKGAVLVLPKVDDLAHSGAGLIIFYVVFYSRGAF